MNVVGTHSPKPLSKIPQDLLYEILSYIADYKNFKKLSLVSKSFRVMSKKNYLWKTIIDDIERPLENHINSKINHFQFFRRIRLKVSKNGLSDMDETIYHQYNKLTRNCDKIQKLVDSELNRRKKETIVSEKYKKRQLFNLGMGVYYFVIMFLIEVCFIFFVMFLNGTNMLNRLIYNWICYGFFVAFCLAILFAQIIEIFVNRKLPFPISRISFSFIKSKWQRKKVLSLIEEITGAEENEVNDGTNKNNGAIIVENKKKKLRKPKILKRKRTRNRKSVNLKWKKKWGKTIKQEMKKHYELLEEDLSSAGIKNDTVTSREVSSPDSPIHEKKENFPKKRRVFFLESHRSHYSTHDGESDFPSEIADPEAPSTFGFSDQMKKLDGEFFKFAWEDKWTKEKNESLNYSIISYFYWVYYWLICYGVRLGTTMFSENPPACWYYLILPILLYVLFYNFLLLIICRKFFFRKLYYLVSVIGVGLSKVALIILIELKVDFDLLNWSTILLFPAVGIIFSILLSPAYMFLNYIMKKKKDRERFCYILLSLIIIIISGILIFTTLVLLGLNLDKLLEINYFYLCIPFGLFLVGVHGYILYSVFALANTYSDNSTEKYLNNL